MHGRDGPLSAQQSHRANTRSCVRRLFSEPTTIPLTPPVLYVITVSDRRGAHAIACASSRGFLETFTSEKRNIQSTVPHLMLSSQLTSRKGGNTPDCLPQVPPQVRFHRGGIMRIFSRHARTRPPARLAVKPSRLRPKLRCSPQKTTILAPRR